ncbi:hypothetical protein BDR22DRAFT_823431 [Usnea florida]
MHSSLIFTSLLPLLASTNPLPLSSRQSTLNPFTLIAGRSGSPIHLSSINANGESFWIGKNTTTYCPSEEVKDCPPGLYTELLAAHLTNNSNHQYAEVPGGQTVYVLPTGALTFTLAHAEGQPFENNGTTTGFSFTPGSDNALGVFSFTGLNSTGFLACPAENGTAPWQVFAAIAGIQNSDVPGGNVSACLEFVAFGASGAELGTANTGGPAAWQYE